MGLTTVDLRLRTGKAHVLPIRWKLDTHFFAHPFKDLRNTFDLKGTGVPNREHGIFVALFGANSHRAAIRSRSDHLEG